jgi:hypothetical protein
MTSFGNQLDKFKDKTIKRLDSVVYGTIFKLSRKLVERSPVGDWTWWKGRQISPGIYAGYSKSPIEGYIGGHFRANWQHGESFIPNGELTGTRNDYLQRLNSTMSAKPSGKIHYIVNNTPYSQRIENGWSWHQAPSGVVGLSILEFPQFIRQSVLEAK